MGSLVVVVALLSALAVLANAEGEDVVFDNQWDRPLDFECPEGEVITSVYSIHGDRYGDRRYSFECRAPAPGARADFCGWTPKYLNLWKKQLTFMCPNNFAIAGAKSFHNNYYEDRRWMFKCCRDSNYIETPCAISGYLNELDSVLNYKAPADTIIRGWFSWYNDESQDRRNKFVTCQMEEGTVNPKI